MLVAMPFALAAGPGAEPVVSRQLVTFVIVFTVPGGIETSLLVCAQRRLSVVRAWWLRRGWWPEAS